VLRDRACALPADSGEIMQIRDELAEAVGRSGPITCLRSAHGPATGRYRIRMNPKVTKSCGAIPRMMSASPKREQQRRDLCL
jgi:hypothetical protein